MAYPCANRVGATIKLAGIKPMNRRLALETLERLEAITARVRKDGGINVEPMQLAALLLEKTTRQLSEAEAEKLVRPQRRASG